MSDYKTIWKKLAANKQITADTVVQYAALKAIKAKSQNKEAIFKAQLRRAFSPDKNGHYHGLQSALSLLRWNSTRPNYNLLFTTGSSLLDDEEYKVYVSLITNAYNKLDLKDPNHYSYIFVRQDMRPEYQLVQAAHATCLLGQNKSATVDASNLYFVIVGVEDLGQLEETISFLEKRHQTVEKFIEPDFGNEMTAIATHPIPGHLRGPLKKFKLLTF